MSVDPSAFRKYKPVVRPTGLSARRLQEPLPAGALSRIERVEALLKQPYVGITTGEPVTGLYPVERTGASTQPIQNAAERFIASMSPKQRAESMHPVDSPNWFKWANGELYILRHGVLLEDLPEAQLELALDILRATFSERGFAQVRDLMRLNEFLMEYSVDTECLGEWLYFLSFYGTPSQDKPWGWQIDGHHVNVNCFVLGDQMVLTPLFMGAEPLCADAGRYKGTRVFDDEQERGLAFVRSLSPAQQEKAILFRTMLSKELPPERAHRTEGRQVTGAAFDNQVMPYEGIRTTELNESQRAALLNLIAFYVGYQAPDHAAVKLREVTRHLHDTWFAWIGLSDDVSPFYYKIQSPVFVMEFDQHKGVFLENKEPERFHSHVIIRTPNGNDYGKALLKQWQEQHRP
jgi:hypothetical protein